MERYICIHGHFYQPPRENAWLESIQLQDSAYPYHDWNERITAECYAPNGASRILDEHNRIVQTVNNYAKISFNVGPTLLSWMESNAPQAYRAILEADQESRGNFSGHGSALAQAYNHMIMPLANRRDKVTQVVWGIRDFERRFGRRPEGMWLPETAVDSATLDIMAEMGIRFTLLAPHQARRVRKRGEKEWRDVDGAKVDSTMPYTLPLPSGRTIALFFYDGPISRAVAFERLLAGGEGFAHRLLGGFSPGRSWPQLVHIATDGETYGHHHRYGDMALAYALHYIQSNNLARLTNYGEYLERHPPTHEVDILENTSWSCSHGVERWRSNCGCRSGGPPDWDQEWRAPLRAALDWLRDTLAPKYEVKARDSLKDPWAARNDYIQVVLDRSSTSLDRFLAQHAIRVLDQQERTTVLKLLELQRHTMLMYTSCGWFIDELSRIETVQVMQYAGRAAQLAQDLFGGTIQSRFLGLLAQARSNVPEHGDGRRVYQLFVKPAAVDLTKVAAHYAVNSLFEQYGQQARVYSYTVDREEYRCAEAGQARLAVGRARFSSQITREPALLTFGVLHLGGHDINGGIREFRGEEAYQTALQEMTEAFGKADFPKVGRLLHKHFGGSSYSLRHLFLDEQRRVLGRLLESTLAEVEAVYSQLYSRQYPPVRFLVELGNPLPKAFQAAAGFLLNTELRKALGEGPQGLHHVRGLLDEARDWSIGLDGAGLGYLLRQTVEKMMDRFISSSRDLSLLKDVVAAVELARSAPLEVDLWRVQNDYSQMVRTTFPEFRERAQRGDAQAEEWVTCFVSLGEQLLVRVQ